MPPFLDRRRFLQDVALAATAAHLGSVDAVRGSQAQPTRTQEKKKATMMPIVDTHQHLWDLSKFRLPWLKEGAPLARSFLPADYQAATAGLQVVKAVYMEVDLDPTQ